MRGRARARNSSLFLLELILALLLFALAGTVCVRLFAQARIASARSEQLSAAVNDCRSVAEIIRSSDTKAQAVDSLQEIYPEIYPEIYQELPGKEDTLILAKGTQRTDPVIRIELSESEEMLTGRIAAADEDTEIYTLTVEHHMAKETIHAADR